MTVIQNWRVLFVSEGGVVFERYRQEINLYICMKLFMFTVDKLAAVINKTPSVYTVTTRILYRQQVTNALPSVYSQQHKICQFYVS